MTTTINASTTLGLQHSADTSGILQLQTADTAALTINSSQNVGIGTASPTQKFDLTTTGATNAILVAQNTTATNGGAQLRAGNPQNLFIFGTDSNAGGLTGTANSSFLYTSSTTPMVFLPNGTERMRIDSSGSLLVGTTGNSTGATIQSNIAVGSTPTNFLPNLSFRASNSSVLDKFWSWRTSPSNGLRLSYSTESSPTTFSDYLAVDNSGNVGIGVTSPGARLSVQVSGMSNPIVIGQSSSSNYGSLSFNGNNNDGGRIGFTAGYSSNQNLYYDVTGSGAHVWRYGNVPDEAMRLNSSGNLLLGTASGAQRLSVVGSVSSGYLVSFTASISSGNSYGVLSTITTAPNDTSSAFYYGTDSSSTRFAVRSNGGIANFSANNVNLSDSREKTNANLAGDYLAKICAIPVRTYNYIDQNLETDPGLTLGVFAQDVQEVAPELVSESDWGTPEEPKMRLSIYQTDLQYALMKCIQEQQALITTLTERISALENK